MTKKLHDKKAEILNEIVELEKFKTFLCQPYGIVDYGTRYLTKKKTLLTAMYEETIKSKYAELDKINYLIERLDSLSV